MKSGGEIRSKEEILGKEIRKGNIREIGEELRENEMRNPYIMIFIL